MKNNKIELILSLKTNNILLDESKDEQICKQMENKVNVKNAIVLYYAAHRFKLSSLRNILLPCIERCFPIVAESNNFLELDFIHVAKIILSSDLNTDSELQVLRAADGWLSHNITERSKYATCILSKIRLLLLSDPALNYILKSNFFSA